MYQLTLGGTLVAQSVKPFTFDEEQFVWAAADYRMYDYNREIEQSTDDENAAADFQRSSALVVPAPVVTPTQFKRLFTGSERVAIKKARATDDLLEDFFSLLDELGSTDSVDLGLQSTLDVLNQLQELEIITVQRRVMILAGTAQ